MKHPSSVKGFIALSALVIMALSIPAHAVFTFQGTVVCTENGEPLPGISVFFIDLRDRYNEVVTDASGAFFLAVSAFSDSGRGADSMSGEMGLLVLLWSSVSVAVLYKATVRYLWWKQVLRPATEGDDDDDDEDDEFEGVWRTPEGDPDSVSDMNTLAGAADNATTVTIPGPAHGATILSVDATAHEQVLDWFSDLL